MWEAFGVKGQILPAHALWLLQHDVNSVIWNPHQVNNLDSAEIWNTFSFQLNANTRMWCLSNLVYLSQHLHIPLRMKEVPLGKSLNFILIWWSHPVIATKLNSQQNCVNQVHCKIHISKLDFSSAQQMFLHTMRPFKEWFKHTYENVTKKIFSLV